MKYPSDRLPVLSFNDVMKVLQKQGYHFTHGKGSHASFTDGVHNVTAPRHEEISPKTLLSIIQQMGITKGVLEIAIEGI